MTKLTYPVLFASLALAYGHALAVDTSVPKAEDYEAVPESEMPKQPKDDQTGKLKPKFPVKIDTQDSEIKEMLEEYLPLITQQQDEELDKEQVGFLAEEAPDNVKTMLRTKGYFNSNVNIQDHGESYTVNVTPGPRTKVDNVSVAILGDVLNDDNLAEYYQNAMENWQQPVGENFDQDGWSASKTSVLSAVTRKKYPLAKLTTTQATINPNTQKADLNVIVESNRPITSAISKSPAHAATLRAWFQAWRASNPVRLTTWTKSSTCNRR